MGAAITVIVTEWLLETWSPLSSSPPLQQLIISSSRSLSPSFSLSFSLSLPLCVSPSLCFSQL